MVMDINSGAFNSNPANIIAMNNVIYFTATGSKGNELWQTDGTPTGTLLLKDIFDDNLASDPLHFKNVNGQLYFSATDGIHGRELWKSDGTTVVLCW